MLHTTNFSQVMGIFTRQRSALWEFHEEPVGPVGAMGISRGTGRTGRSCRQRYRVPSCFHCSLSRGNHYSSIFIIDYLSRSYCNTYDAVDRIGRHHADSTIAFPAGPIPQTTKSTKFRSFGFPTTDSLEAEVISRQHL